MSDRTTVIEAAFAGKLGTFTLQVAFTMPIMGVTALFGPSGSGKTTILRCIAGLQRLPGRFAMGGQVWQDSERNIFLRPHKRPLGYVFQEPSLFSHLTVRRNLLYGAKRASRDGHQALNVEDVVQLLGVRHLLDRAPASLSGGERQRVAIGRALLSQPRLLLMDEPLSALDRAAKGEILPYLEAVRDRLSIPILYVSHDIGEVSRLAQHTIVLGGGKKVAEGSVTNVLERLDLQPATGRFEAGVVLVARVRAHDHHFQLTELDHHGQTLVIPITTAQPGSELRLRVRARDVLLATERPRKISVRNVLTGTVAAIVEERETAYAETLIDLGHAKLRARVTRAAVADLRLHLGQPVFALIKSVTFERPNRLPATTSPRASLAV